MFRHKLTLISFAVVVSRVLLQNSCWHAEAFTQRDFSIVVP